MTKKFLLITLFATSVVISACTHNTITGKKYISLISDAEIMAASNNEYRQFISSNKVLTAGTSSDAASVTRVGNKVIAAVKKHYQSIGKTAEIANYNWEINTVSSKEANAWCMPGGKIVVYSGILQITKNDAALAVVIGHEVTHALANHGKQRMSNSLLQQLGGQALSVALANKPQETQALFNSAYGLGSQYGVMLPFARKDEYEADKFGLMFTALAGYDPRESIKFWQRMSAAAGSGQKPPEFASTHPSDENRIAQLQSIMDDTIAKYYKP